jgi:hypothetical protein
VYARYSDWARWFWKGAVHIDDVAAAVILSLDLVSRQQPGQLLILTLDSAYEYTDADLAHWDAEGARLHVQEILFRILRSRALLWARSGPKANQAGYFRTGLDSHEGLKSRGLDRQFSVFQTRSLSPL